jgi:hypothetical protein
MHVPFMAFRLRGGSSLNMRSLAHPKGGGRVRFPVDFECWLALVRSCITRDETASGSHQKFG